MCKVSTRPFILALRNTSCYNIATITEVVSIVFPYKITNAMHDIFLLDDTLMEILSHLGKDELMNTSFVNKRMCELIHGSLLWGLWINRNIPLRVSDELIMPRYDGGPSLGSARHYASLCSPRRMNVLILWKAELSRITVIDMPGLDQVCCFWGDGRKKMYLLRHGWAYLRNVKEPNTELECHAGIYNGHIRKIAVQGAGVTLWKMFFLTDAGTFHTLMIDSEGLPLIETIETPAFMEATVATATKGVDFSVVEVNLYDYVVYVLTADGLIFVKKSADVAFRLIESLQCPLVCLNGGMFAQTSGELRDLRHLRKGKPLPLKSKPGSQWSFNGSISGTLYNFLRLRGGGTGDYHVMLGLRNSAIARDLDGLRKKELIVFVDLLTKTRGYDRALRDHTLTLEPIVDFYDIGVCELKVNARKDDLRLLASSFLSGSSYAERKSLCGAARAVVMAYVLKVMSKATLVDSARFLGIRKVKSKSAVQLRLLIEKAAALTDTVSYKDIEPTLMDDLWGMSAKCLERLGKKYWTPINSRHRQKDAVRALTIRKKQFQVAGTTPDCSQAASIEVLHAELKKRMIPGVSAMSHKEMTKIIHMGADNREM